MRLLVFPPNTGSFVRRGGTLTGGLCLGMCCLAVFGAGPTRTVSAAPPKPAAEEATADDGPVFVDDALTAKSTRRSGFAPYKSFVATLGGEVFRRSLMTEVSGIKPGDTLSVLTLKIDGKYERFQATVGRSDSESRSGPAYAYFEVWGDGTCFFRSTPIRSAAAMVTTPAGASIRKTPQTINIIVRGTRTLQLVTRYASTLDQQAPDVSRAHGCVWGDPRLLTALTAAASAAPAAVAAAVPATPTPAPVTPRIAAKSPTKPSVKPPQTSASAKNTREPADPRRDEVRMAVLLLASGVGSAIAADSPDTPPTLRYPLKIALLPLRPVLPAASDNQQRRRGPSSAGGAQPTDDRLQKLLEASLPTARRGKNALFTLSDTESATQITRLLPASLLTAIVEPTRADILPLASLCRAKQVDAILVPTLLPGSGTTSRGGFRLDLRLFDPASGTLLARSQQVISPINRN